MVIVEGGKIDFCLFFVKSCCPRSFRSDLRPLHRRKAGLGQFRVQLVVYVWYTLISKAHGLHGSAGPFKPLPAGEWCVVTVRRSRSLLSGAVWARGFGTADPIGDGDGGDRRFRALALCGRRGRRQVQQSPFVRFRVRNGDARTIDASQG